MRTLNIDPKKMYRLSLEEAKSLLYANSMSVFSGVRIETSDDGSAKTDGQTVFLPEYKQEFPDQKTDLSNNRNATMYLSDLIHEIGYHICAGSFLVDSEPTLNKFPNLKLAHIIYNILEDYRGRQHFRTCCPLPDWVELLDEEEQFFVSKFDFFYNWKEDFLSLLIAKGIYGYTPGDVKPGGKSLEKKLLREKCEIYLPPKATAITMTLQVALEQLVEKIRWVKGKTVADSLLMVEPLYLILVQILGDNYKMEEKLGNCSDKKMAGGDNGEVSSEPDTLESEENNLRQYCKGDDDFRNRWAADGRQSDRRPESCNFKNISDLGKFPGQDVVRMTKKESKKNRPQQLKTFSSFIMPFQNEMNVPLKVKEKLQGGVVTNMPSGNRQQKKTPLLEATTKIYGGNYDNLCRRKIKGRHDLVLLKESRRSGQFKEIYREYASVFTTMEEEVAKLLQKKETVTFEGRDPDELIIENLIEGIADPTAIPHLDLYENEAQDAKQILGKLEVKILVDASGSTAGTILEVEKVFAAVLYQAFKTIKAEVDLYFFHTLAKTRIIQAMHLDAIGWIKPAGANRDGAAIRFIADRFKKNADHNIFIIFSDGLPSAEKYFGVAALQDTLDAMYKAAQKNIAIRYFNIGGMPDTILHAFKRYTSHSRIFIDPQELITYAPIFIAELLTEMREAE